MAPRPRSVQSLLREAGTRLAFFLSPLLPFNVTTLVDHTSGHPVPLGGSFPFVDVSRYPRSFCERTAEQSRRGNNESAFPAPFLDRGPAQRTLQSTRVSAAAAVNNPVAGNEPVTGALVVRRQRGERSQGERRCSGSASGGVVDGCCWPAGVSAVRGGPVQAWWPCGARWSGRVAGGSCTPPSVGTTGRLRATTSRQVVKGRARGPAHLQPPSPP